MCFKLLLLSFLLLLKFQLRFALEKVLKASLLDEFSDAVIVGFIEGIKVKSKRAREHHRILGNHCDLVSQVGKLKLGDINTIDVDLTVGKLNNSCQGHA